MTDAPQSPRPLAERLEPVALAMLLSFVCTLIGHIPDWRADLGRFQALFVVAFAAYGLAVMGRGRWRALPRAGTFVVLVALALRAAVLPVTPTLSDDVYRYAWEGRVLALGGDPYRQPPADSALVRFRDAEVHPHVNHPELRAIYPPLAEAGFALVARFWYSLLAFKLWVLLHDLVLCVLLVKWCRARGGSAWDALIYAWNPLVVTEYAGTAHHDPTGIVWLVAALLYAERRPVFSAAASITAVMVKLVALPVVPFLLRDWPARVRIIAVTVLSACLAGYLLLTRGPGSGLEAYANHWRHNDALFALIAGPWGDRTARVVALAAVVAIGVFVWRKRWSTLAATRVLMRAGLLLGPVVHPWYLGWVLAFECTGPSAGWLLLSCTVTLGYGAFVPPLDGGGYHPPLAWRLVEYGLPVLLTLGLMLWRGAVAARRGPPNLE